MTCKDPIVFQMILYLFLGPEQGTCKDPIVFKMILFFLCPKRSHFSLPEHTPKLTKLGI